MYHKPLEPFCDISKGFSRLINNKAVSYYPLFPSVMTIKTTHKNILLKFLGYMVVLNNSEIIITTKRKDYDMRMYRDVYMNIRIIT